MRYRFTYVFRRYWLGLIALGVLMSAPVWSQDEATDATPSQEVIDTSTNSGSKSDAPLSQEVEALKKASLELNRDMLILEEELLFPANTQISLFMSVDVGEYFRLDSVKIKIDDKLIASHLYTDRQNHALSRGGIQRIYVGNLKSGEHELTAIYTGKGPNDREYKRGSTIKIEKDEGPKMLEVRVMDSTSNMQPDFDFKEWEL